MGEYVFKVVSMVECVRVTASGSDVRVLLKKAPAGGLPNVLAGNARGRRHAFPRQLRTGVLQEAPWLPRAHLLASSMDEGW